MITYIVENTDNEVLGYYEYLSSAKNKLIAEKTKGVIIKVKGDYFGEGFHQYYLEYNGTNFKYNKKR